MSAYENCKSSMFPTARQHPTQESNCHRGERHQPTNQPTNQHFLNHSAVVRCPYRSTAFIGLWLQQCFRLIVCYAIRLMCFDVALGLLLFVDVTLRENCTIGNTLNTHALWRFPFLFETAAIDGLVSSWTENISVSFCLRAPGYGLTLWCALGLLVGGAIQVASVTVTVTVTWHCVVFYKSCYISVVDSLMARVKQYMVDMAGKENNVIRTKFSEM